MAKEMDFNEINARRIAMVESCFGSSGVTLAIPGRVLVGEGELAKMCRKKLKLRQFYLFNDILVYGNIIIKKKKFNKQHIIPLEEVKLESIEDEGSQRNGWLIKTPSKSFAVFSGTSTEKQEWMAHINKWIEDRLRKSGKKAIEEHAAVWVPDWEALVCMSCKKSQFTVLNRRHHCRKCGAVVCGPCSKKKFCLPNQSSKPVRVCVLCYDTLSKAKAQNNISTNTDSKEQKSGSEESSGEEDSDDDEDSVNCTSEAQVQPKFYGNPGGTEEQTTN